MPDGSKKALHHVKDAKAISDLIRLARLDEVAFTRSLSQSLVEKGIRVNGVAPRPI
jgi:NAD(P)-dependent dehydrogenase (short-subunit alcohol dehydrogenase family)